MEKQTTRELADFTIRLLKPGSEEKYVFPPDCQAIFSRAFDAVFAAPVDAKLELEALMALGWALESDHKSPSAGAEIIRALADNSRVLSTLGIAAPARARELKKWFGAKKVSAPVFGEHAPEGSMKLSSFLEPGRETRAPGRRPKPQGRGQRP